VPTAARCNQHVHEADMIPITPLLQPQPHFFWLLEAVPAVVKSKGHEEIWRLTQLTLSMTDSKCDKLDDDSLTHSRAPLSITIRGCSMEVRIRLCATFLRQTTPCTTQLSPDRHSYGRHFTCSGKILLLPRGNTKITLSCDLNNICTCDSICSVCCLTLIEHVLRYTNRTQKAMCPISPVRTTAGRFLVHRLTWQALLDTLCCLPKWGCTSDDQEFGFSISLRGICCERHRI
jgi:hypothetical protein